MCWYPVSPLKTGADRNSMGEKEVYVVKQIIIKFLTRDGGSIRTETYEQLRA